MTSQDSAAPLGKAPTPVVLDTNVVLDWLVFDDPATRALGAAVASGELRWVATVAMREELAHVIQRGALGHRPVDESKLWASWAKRCVEVSAPTSPFLALRCTDPDDQKFIDLAAATANGFLLSRDRAVLKLARKLALRGVTVGTPTVWASRWRTVDPEGAQLKA